VLALGDRPRLGLLLVGLQPLHLELMCRPLLQLQLVEAHVLQP